MATMEKPLLFISSNQDGQLSINDEVINMLCEIDRPITTVGIAGKYRTGKSYLLNLLFGQGKGFDIGSTIQAKTKGIWIWCRPHPIHKDRFLILLDTEGLSDVEKGDETHDNRIFALTTLLTSCLVYNSMGTIDNEALQKLHFITSMTEHLKLKSNAEETGEDFDAIFPLFIWVVRDFTLTLDLNGVPCTSDDYLDNALKPKAGHSKAVREFNLPRECLRNFFRWRKCFTICKPVDDDDKMKRLDTVPLDQLKPDFLKAMDHFKDLVLRDTQIMKVHEVKVTGIRLLEIAKSYITAINQGAVPCVENAVHAMGRAECERAIDRAKECYRENMKAKINGNLPMEVGNLSSIHEIAEKLALKEYTNTAIFDQSGHYQNQLQGEVMSIYHGIKESNYDTSAQECDMLLKQLTLDMKRKSENGDYVGSNCYALYKADLDEVVQRYKAERHRGPAHETVLATFLEEKKSEGAQILAVDKALTEQERKLAAEEEKHKRAEQEKVAAEENKQRVQKELEDFKNSMQVHMQQMSEDYEKGMQEFRKSSEELLKKRQEEQEEMLEKGLKTQAEKMEQSIKALQDENNQTEELYQKNIKQLEQTLKENTAQIDDLKQNRLKEYLQIVHSVAEHLLPALCSAGVQLYKANLKTQQTDSKPSPRSNPNTDNAAQTPRKVTKVPGSKRLNQGNNSTKVKGAGTAGRSSVTGPRVKAAPDAKRGLQGVPHDSLSAGQSGMKNSHIPRPDVDLNDLKSGYRFGDRSDLKSVVPRFGFNGSTPPGSSTGQPGR